MLQKFFKVLAVRGTQVDNGKADVGNAETATKKSAAVSLLSGIP